MTDGSVRGLVDHLFRHEAGRMVAALVRSLGVQRLDLAEEAVQEALVRALRRWPYQGVPDNPAAWLQRVAHNAALDAIRRRSTADDKVDAVVQERLRSLGASPGDGAAFAGEVSDDQLRLAFLCCHPSLSRDAQVALTLKLVSNLSVEEIAAAFLSRPSTVAQRIVRAKRTLRQTGADLSLPAGPDLLPRLDAVLEVLYLSFSAGYTAHVGEDLVRADLCAEAIRLTRAMAGFPSATGPEVHALLSLMCFQASRLPARSDQRGALVVLADQDRTRWDRGLITEGFHHLGESLGGRRETRFHLEAAIAAAHAAAVEDGTPDWSRILGLTDRLVEISPTAVVTLNRCVAVAKVHGPQPALEVVDELLTAAPLAHHPATHATHGWLLLEAGRPEAAAAAFDAAAAAPCSTPQQSFFQERARQARDSASWRDGADPDFSPGNG